VSVLWRFVRNLALSGIGAGALLGAFAASSHRLHVLPADASPLGVLLGALVLAGALTLAGGLFAREL
jgi:hypothetical protein